MKKTIKLGDSEVTFEGTEEEVISKMGESFEAYNRQGIAAEKQNRERTKGHYKAILEVLIRDPLWWEVIVEKVTGKPIEHPGTISTN